MTAKIESSTFCLSNCVDLPQQRPVTVTDVDESIYEIFKSTISGEDRWDYDGSFDLRFYPYKCKWIVMDEFVSDFSLDPNSGMVSFAIPKMEKEICFFVINHGCFFSERGEDTKFEFEPCRVLTTVYVYEKKDVVWNSRYKFLFFSEKFFVVPVFVSEVDETSSVGRTTIMRSAESWLGCGNFVKECYGIYNGGLVQDFKALSFLVAGACHQELIEECIGSEFRIEEKKANLNCLQFCLLMYIKAKVISWDIVAEVYRRVEILDSNPHNKIRIPMVVKWRRYKQVNFDRDEATPRTADLVFWGDKVNEELHCALFQEVDKLQKGCFSCIEMGSSVVQKQSHRLSERYFITFVRKDDVERNISDFLTQYNI